MEDITGLGPYGIIRTNHRTIMRYLEEERADEWGPDQYATLTVVWSFLQLAEFLHQNFEGLDDYIAALRTVAEDFAAEH